jgi:hypothetical protein
MSGVFTHMGPLVVNPETTRGWRVSYQFDVRGGPRFILRYEDGTGRAGPAGSGRVDCHLVGDPVTMLLFGYGRIDQWGAIARGKLAAWGRKPWMGLLFRRYVLKP